MTDPETEKGVDLLPDAWERFERAVDAAVKSGPMHRDAKAARSNGIKERRSRPIEEGQKPRTK